MSQKAAQALQAHLDRNSIRELQNDEPLVNQGFPIEGKTPDYHVPQQKASRNLHAAQLEHRTYLSLASVGKEGLAILIEAKERGRVLLNANEAIIRKLAESGWMKIDGDAAILSKNAQTAVTKIIKIDT